MEFTSVDAWKLAAVVAWKPTAVVAWIPAAGSIVSLRNEQQWDNRLATLQPYSW
jgi:hypothetical protein